MEGESVMGDRMWTVDDDISTKYPIYTRGNVGEVFPDPVAPLSWTLMGRTGAEMGWRDAWVKTGAFDYEEFGNAGNVIVAVFGSYCYLNVSLARIFAVRTPGFTPEMMDQALFGTMDGVPPYTALPTDADSEKEAALGATLGWVFTVQDFPEIEADAAATRELRAKRPDFSTMSTDEVLDYGLHVMRSHFRGLFAAHLHTSFLATVPLGMVSGICEAIGQGPAAMTLTSGLGGVDSAAPSWAMWELGRVTAGSASLTAEFNAGVPGILARLQEKADRSDSDATEFLAGFTEFLVEFGSRGPNEWEMRSPTWETNPEIALAAIERIRLAPKDDSPQQRWETRVAEREALTPALVAALAADPATQGQFAAAISAAGKFLPARERTKTNIIRMVQESRIAFREWGRRLVDKGQLDEIEDFGLIEEEELAIARVDTAPLREKIRERRAMMEMFAGLDPPFVLNGETIHYDNWPKKDSRPIEIAKSGDVLTGLSGAPGTYTGRARVVLSAADPLALEPGDVLIAPITDPSWTPLFVPAGAVVVNVGAAASHAVIVSREIGLPCVVSVSDATRRIPDGAMITVDGSAGTVTIL